MNNYKGEYFGDDTEQKYYEGGAHFQFKDLCNRLEAAIRTFSPSRRSKLTLEGENIEAVPKNKDNFKNQFSTMDVVDKKVDRIFDNTNNIGISSSRITGKKFVVKSQANGGVEAMSLKPSNSMKKITIMQHPVESKALDKITDREQPLPIIAKSRNIAGVQSYKTENKIIYNASFQPKKTFFVDSSNSNSTLKKLGGKKLNSVKKEDFNYQFLKYIKNDDIVPLKDDDTNRNGFNAFLKKNSEGKIKIK